MNGAEFVWWILKLYVVLLIVMLSEEWNEYFTLSSTSLFQDIYVFEKFVDLIKLYIFYTRRNNHLYIFLKFTMQKSIFYIELMNFPTMNRCKSYNYPDRIKFCNWWVGFKLFKPFYLIITLGYHSNLKKSRETCWKSN